MDEINNKMKNRITILAIILFGMISCKKSETDEAGATPTKAYGELEKAGWLIGKWENNTPQGNLSETWSRKNDSVFTATTYFIMNNDTMFSESIELIENDGKLIYNAKVSDQNNGEPVPFTATQTTDKLIEFANPNHDYPNNIAYKRISADSVVAIISGIENGKQKHEEFGMRRAK